MISGKIYRVRLDPGHLVPAYVELYLQSTVAWHAIDRMKTGVSDSGLNLTQNRFRTLQVPVAPRDEQRRIVAAIEEHFSRLDAAEAMLRQTLTHLRILRASILAEIFHTKRDLPEGWAYHDLATLMQGCLFSDGDWVERKDQDENGRIRLIQLADIGEGTFRDRSNRWLNDESASELKCTFLQPNDVLVARMPDPIGRACLVPELPHTSVTAVDVCIMRPDARRVLPKWLMWGLNSSSCRSQMEALQGGTTRKRISRKNLSRISLVIPPTSKQGQTIQQMEEHFNQLDQVKRFVEDSLDQLGALRRSVLAKAFAGQLVPQDPNDEPASVLLERLAASRSAKPARRRART